LQRRALPESAALRLDALVTRLAKQHKGQILLMLDEVQTLGEASDGVALIAALRAVLHKRREEVCAVFTGSSQEGLARLMTTAGAPMYQFAQIVDFPFLDDEFLLLLAKHFESVHPGKKLDLEDLREGFKRIGFKPALMRDVIKAMSAEGITEVKLGLERYRSVGKIRVKTCHIDKILCRQGSLRRHRFWFHIGWVLSESLKFAGCIRAQEGQVGSADIDSLGPQGMECLGLVHHGLQSNSVGHKFVVDDGFFLIRRVIGTQMAASTESEMFGEFVMPFYFGRSLMDRATQGLVHDPLQQVRCADRVSQFLQCHCKSIPGAVTVDLG